MPINDTKLGRELVIDHRIEHFMCVWFNLGFCILDRLIAQNNQFTTIVNQLFVYLSEIQSHCRATSVATASKRLIHALESKYSLYITVRLK